MEQRPDSPAVAAAAPFDTPSFDPVLVRARHDGLTPEKQTGFIRALAESGCVAEAAGAVGMAPRSAPPHQPFEPVRTRDFDEVQREKAERKESTKQRKQAPRPRPG